MLLLSCLARVLIQQAQIKMGFLMTCCTCFTAVWMVEFAQVNVRLVVILKEPWWVEGLADTVLLLDCVQYWTLYSLTCLAFVLGLHAPGRLDKDLRNHAFSIVSDPDPGSGAFLAPVSGIRCLFGPWIRDQE
jgi:hypothetical protein